MQRMRTRGGFSLLELMIALVILGVITSQVFVALSAQQQAFRGETRSLDLQESARLVLDLITVDTRNAGMLVPSVAGVSSVDGGNANPDTLCLSDGTIFNIPAFGTDPFWDELDHRFYGASVSGGGTSLIMPPPDPTQPAQIDATDFTVGDGVIIATDDGSQTFCAQVVAPVSPTSITISPGVPFPLGGNAIAVPAVHYDVAGTTLRRNGVAMSNNVDDLQVEYWVDSAGLAPNGVVDASEWPVHDLNAMVSLDTSRIRRVRISIVGIANVGDEDPAGGQKHHRPGLANRAQGPIDNLEREIVTASVFPRNLLSYEYANVP